MTESPINQANLTITIIILVGSIQMSHFIGCECYAIASAQQKSLCDECLLLLLAVLNPDFALEKHFTTLKRSFIYLQTPL
jgi:hypothetical protein